MPASTSSGYWRIGAPLDIYHFALLDVAGDHGVHLTNGSAGRGVHSLCNHTILSFCLVLCFLVELRVQ